MFFVLSAQYSEVFYDKNVDSTTKVKQERVGVGTQLRRLHVLTDAQLDIKWLRVSSENLNRLILSVQLILEEG